MIEKGEQNLTREVSGNKYAPSTILGNGIFHPETFVGSATVSVNKTNRNELSVQIFNVTSLTSGDYEKHLPWNNWPMSVVRTNSGTLPNRYGNISQTYSFTVPVTSK